MKRALSLLTIVALVLPLCLTGCGEAEQDADLTFIIGQEHNHLDPQKMSWLHDIRLAGMLFEPLVEKNYKTMATRPAVATRWDTSDDQTVYTFHLRKDAKWSNGEPVTAGDFKYAWRRAMLPDMAADYTKLMFHIEGARDFFDWRNRQLEQFAQSDGGQQAAQALWDKTRARFDESVGVEAVDARTLRVTLQRPVPYFLDLTAFATFMPVHRASVESATRIDADTAMRRTRSGYWSEPGELVTNGPYKLRRHRFQQDVWVEKNPHYWNRDAVKSATIRERIISDPQNALLTYRSGGADIWPGVPTASDMASELVRQGGPDVHRQQMAGVYFYNFNCEPTLPDGRDNPLAEARVRRALAMAIDRQTIVKRVTQLNQPIARSYVPGDALPNYDPPVDEGVTFDPERARELLAEAGHPDGEGLSGLSILYNTGHGHEMIAQAVQQMWRKHLNVIVSLEPREGKAFSNRLDERDYTIARASWFGDYPDPTTWLQKLTTDSGNNDCGWSNAEYDALLEQAKGETDVERRRRLLREAESILLREQPMALMFQYVNIYLWDPDKVTGLEPNGWARWDFENIAVK